MTTKDFINRIGDLIGKDDLKTAITELRNLLQKSKKLDEIILHSARYNDLMKQIRIGTISFEDANITKNKIRYAVLDMLCDIEENIETNPELESEVNETLKENESFIIQNTSKIGDNSNNNAVIQGLNNVSGNFTIGN